NLAISWGSLNAFGECSTVLGCMNPFFAALLALTLLTSCEGQSKESSSMKDTSKLTPLQYHCTQEDGTEPPLKNEYWDNKRDGIYVDVVSGEALFSSKDKYDSGSGWPSFTKPLEKQNVVTREDKKHGMVRTEVRSSKGNSHLGHVFDDGPKEAGGL